MAVSIAALFVLLSVVAVLGYIWKLDQAKSNCPCPSGRWQWCPWCRKPLTVGEVAGRQRIKCSCCDFVLWDNPKPVSATLIPRGNCIVLIRRTTQPGAGKLALPGGYVEPDESTEDGAKREAKEETGLNVEIERLLAITMPAGVNEHIHFYLTKPVTAMPSAGDDAGEVVVVDKHAVPFDDIAFDTHKNVIRRWLQEETA